MALPAIDRLMDSNQLRDLVQRARLEDMGPQLRDVTSLVMRAHEQAGQAVFRARRAGRLCAAALLPVVAEVYDPTLVVEPIARDGDRLEADQPIATVRGSLRSILAMERVALNFLIHLSGVATLTDRYVQAIQGTRACICDTRKTIPGLRPLQKYAVLCGGGVNHRMGLHDAVLIKDNHLAHLPLSDWPRAIRQAKAAAAAADPQPAFVEVEVDTLGQLQVVLPCGADLILLDNMTTSQMQQAVSLRDRLAPQVKLEASGGVDLDSVQTIARTGVDRIAIGALTHSAPALDIGLDILA